MCVRACDTFPQATDKIIFDDDDATGYKVNFDMITQV
jgi:hypothetical protein